jgi:hypothetical protein
MRGHRWISAAVGTALLLQTMSGVVAFASQKETESQEETTASEDGWWITGGSDIEYTPVIWTTLDDAEKEEDDEDTLRLTFLLTIQDGSLSEEADLSSFTFDGDLEGAVAEELNFTSKNRTEAELIVSLSMPEADLDDLFLNGSITVDGSSLIRFDGEAVEGTVESTGIFWLQEESRWPEDGTLTVFNADQVTDDTTVIKVKISGNPYPALSALYYGYSGFRNLRKIYIDCSEAEFKSMDENVQSYFLRETGQTIISIYWYLREKMRRLIGSGDRSVMEPFFQSLDGPVYGIEFINPCEELADLIQRLQENDAATLETYRNVLDDEDRANFWAAKYLLTITYEEQE